MYVCLYVFLNHSVSDHFKQTYQEERGLCFPYVTLKKAAEDHREES